MLLFFVDGINVEFSVFLCYNRLCNSLFLHLSDGAKLFSIIGGQGMDKVNKLMIIWTDVEDVGFEESNEMTELVREKGFNFTGDPTGVTPSVLEFELTGDGISLYGLVGLVRKIEALGKYEVFRMELYTIYDDYYDEEPYAAINLMKKE